jgi:hypothetical protein
VLLVYLPTAVEAVVNKILFLSSLSNRIEQLQKCCQIKQCQNQCKQKEKQIEIRSAINCWNIWNCQTSAQDNGRFCWLLKLLIQLSKIGWRWWSFLLTVKPINTTVKDQLKMMHCDIELLPAVIEQAKLLLGDYSDSDVDESVRLFTTSIIVAQLKCRSIIIFQWTPFNYRSSIKMSFNYCRLINVV